MCVSGCTISYIIRAFTNLGLATLAPFSLLPSTNYVVSYNMEASEDEERKRERKCWRERKGMITQLYECNALNIQFDTIVIF